MNMHAHESNDRKLALTFSVTTRVAEVSSSPKSFLATTLYVAACDILHLVILSLVTIPSKLILMSVDSLMTVLFLYHVIVTVLSSVLREQIKSADLPSSVLYEKVNFVISLLRVFYDCNLQCL